jgi:hypothetical protein
MRFTIQYLWTKFRRINLPFLRLFPRFADELWKYLRISLIPPSSTIHHLILQAADKGGGFSKIVIQRYTYIFWVFRLILRFVVVLRFPSIFVVLQFKYENQTKKFWHSNLILHSGNAEKNDLNKYLMSKVSNFRFLLQRIYHVCFVIRSWINTKCSAFQCHEENFLRKTKYRLAYEDWCVRITPLDTTRPSTIFYRLLLNWTSLRRHQERSLRMAM